MLSTDFAEIFEQNYKAVFCKFNQNPLHIKSLNAAKILGMSTRLLTSYTKKQVIRGYKFSPSINSTYLYKKEDLKRYFIQVNVNNINRNNK